MKIIEVHNLSKKYRLGQKQLAHYSLREEAINLAKKSFSLVSGQRKKREDFWALKDVNFSIEKGEVVGIMGRNGVGKTTLLKILSRITPPTEGQAIIRGRVSSLLEVGIAFHPELNGRENIYLNGAILGMRKKEIDSRFEEIVEFAEVEKFLDTPLKKYSSGMCVRLAFAIAAHLEPDVLLVDEVLAVGDYEFQKKCLKKMDKVSHEGRTVLFVSHNMDTMAKLCSRAILLDSGKIVMDGSIADVIERYIGLRKEMGSEISWEDPAKAPGDATAKLKKVRILSEEEKPSSQLDIDKDILIELFYWNFIKGAKLLPSIRLINNEGITVFTAVDMVLYGHPSQEGLFRSVCRIPGNFLNQGCYFVDVIISGSAGIMDDHIFEQQLISFDVVEPAAMRKEYSANWVGVVRPPCNWKTEYQEPLNN